MKNFSIVAKKNEKSFLIEQKIKKALMSAKWKYDKKQPDLVICVGGDGTLLYAVHKYLEQLDHVQFVAIHTGTLGFFTDYTEEELELCISDILHQKPRQFCSYLLHIKADEQEYYALNEMRIESVQQTQVMDVYVDGEFFETCRGSGVCLSTQAGATAYSRGLGGAVIDSGLSVMQMTEIIAIQHSKHRSLGSPYILKDDRKVVFESDDFSKAVLCFDHLSASLKHVKRIECTMSDRCVRFARYREYSYLRRLKNLY